MGESFKINAIYKKPKNLKKKFSISLSNNLLQIILVGITAITCGYFLVKSSIVQYLPFFITAMMLIIIKPHLGLYAIFLSDIWFSYHESPVSRKTIFLLFIISIYMIYFFYKKKIKIDKKVNYIIYAIFILLIWGLIVDYLINEVPFKNFYGTFAKLWLPVLIALILYFFIETEKQLEKFIYIIIFGISLSGLIGILQFIWGGIFYDIVPYPENMDIERGAIFGLSGITHFYASQLASTVPLILSFIFTKNKFRKIFLLAFNILAIALMLTFMRSAIYGCAIGIVMLFIFLMKTKKINAIKMSILSLIFLLLFSVLSRIAEHGERLFQAEGSALGRIPLAISAFYIVRDNPLGVGRGKYQEEVEDYLWLLKRFEHYEVVKVTTPHNQFLNVLVYWGLPGFILLIIFYYQILKRINNIRMASSSEYSKTISTGLFCSYITYIINSMFHNNGAFTGDPFHWYMIGVTFALIKLENKK